MKNKMKNHRIHLTFLLTAVTAFLLVGCGKSPESSDKTTSGKPVATKPVPASAAAQQNVEITANDQMKFSVTAIEAKPGQRIKVVLHNVGTMPKMSMGHNFVVLDGKVEPEAFIEASQMQMANEYIAPELKQHVLAHTKLLGPGEIDSVTFTAPSTPGAYPFICSFPGHYAIGMKGTLTVK